MGYATAQVNDGMKVREHRLVWSQRRGRIPSEHDVHHLDGNARNNAIGNLAMLPRWLHQLCY